MNVVQIHLMLNHVPVIATVMAALLLAAGLVARSQHILRAGLVTLVAAALIAIPVFFTGEPVEEIAEKLPGIDKQRIETHEDAAKASVIFLGLLGAGAIATLVVWRNRALPAGPGAAILALSVIVAAQVAWTAHQGGQIRHTEMTGSAVASGGNATDAGESGEQDDDD